MILATGGWPEPLNIPDSDLIHSSWDVLGGEARLAGHVLVYDEVGDHAGAAVAQVLATSGCTVTLVTPDRAVSHDLGPTNSAVVLRDLAKAGVGFECFQDILAVTSIGNRNQVRLSHTLSGIENTRTVDHVVVENGVRPSDDLYQALKPRSRNLGQVEHQALIEGRSPFEERNPQGAFWLARVGDAIASRNIHAAIYDALRICKDL